MRSLTADQLEPMIIDAMRRDDWAAVAEMELRMDATDRHAPPVPIVSAALWYASVGLHVFPLQPRSKIPHPRTRGCKDATTDQAVIIAWWQRWPESNVAIATGHLVDVIDIDGAEGVASWANLTNLPPILGAVATPRAGGSHLYVAPTGEGNGAKIFPGVDYRGLGGYVVAPPSHVVERGKGYEGLYRWRRPLSLGAVGQAAA